MGRRSFTLKIKVKNVPRYTRDQLGFSGGHNAASTYAKFRHLSHHNRYNYGAQPTDMVCQVFDRMTKLATQPQDWCKTIADQKI